MENIGGHVQRLEQKRLVASISLLFLLCTCHGLLRNMKDSLVITATPAGAQILPFLKTWAILPGSIFGLWVFSLLANRFRRDRVFYLVVSGFLSYFLFFIFFVFPKSDEYRLRAAAAWLSLFLPDGLGGFIAVVEYWPFAIFYVVAELWSSLVLTVLFWGFINTHYRIGQARKKYGLLNLGSNLAPFLGLPAAQLLLTQWDNPILQDVTVTHWHYTLSKVILMVALIGIIAMAIYRWLCNSYDLSSDAAPETTADRPRSKPKLGVIDSLRHVMTDKYLACIAVLVIAYNGAVNLTDVLWKDQLKAFFVDPADMLVHMNNVSIIIGALSTLLALSFSYCIRRFGWRAVAISIPLMMMVFGGAFVIAIIGRNGWVTDLAHALSLAPLAIPAYIGSWATAVTKGAKYSIFDATKEIAFLHFDEVGRDKGKAAIDGLGSSIGKSGSSFTYQVLFVIFGSVGSIAQCAPVVLALLAVLFSLWFSAIIIGSRKFS